MDYITKRALYLFFAKIAQVVTALAASYMVWLWCQGYSAEQLRLIVGIVGCAGFYWLLDRFGGD